MNGLKYVEVRVTFGEVPSEITLCVNISNCPCKCKGCHSSYLADDIGRPLTWDSLNAMIYSHPGITCVSFMGGDSNPEAVSKLAYKVKRVGLKVCWYSGKETISDAIKLKNFDYIKIGPYIEEYGGLKSPTTNQRFYKVINDTLFDITYKFNGNTKD